MTTMGFRLGLVSKPQQSRGAGPATSLSEVFLNLVLSGFGNLFIFYFLSTIFLLEIMPLIKQAVHL